MTGAVVAICGGLAGKRFAIGTQPLTFGRGDENDVVLTTPAASRVHAELRREAGGYVIYDRDSTNGTWVNGASVTSRGLQPGDQIMIGDEIFRFEVADSQTTILPTQIPAPAGSRSEPRASTSALRVTVTGGGPVGLSFALLLEHMMGPRAAVKVYDSRWMRDGDRIVWKGPGQGNVRRQQVVTIQSRQYLKLPPDVQECLFSHGGWTEMWPKGPDSIQDLGPRNIRIAYVEDQLLAVANEKPDRIELRTRLESRIDGLPDDATLRAHLDGLSSELLHTLLVSGAWDSANVGGEEVDIEWLLATPRPSRRERQRAVDQVASAP